MPELVPELVLLGQRLQAALGCRALLLAPLDQAALAVLRARPLLPAPALLPLVHARLLAPTAGLAARHGHAEDGSESVVKLRVVGVDELHTHTCSSTGVGLCRSMCDDQTVFVE